MLIRNTLTRNRDLTERAISSLGNALLAMLVAVIAAIPAVADTTADNDLDVTPWRYTLQKPTDDWRDPGFDESAWKQGDGGFGTRNTPGSRVGTVWNSDDIWIRKTIQIDAIPNNPGLLMHHDEDVEVFLNGKPIFSASQWTQEYQVFLIAESQRDAIRKGKNVLAVHCHQNNGGQFIDVHFVDADHPPTLPPQPPFQSDLMTQWGEQLTAENAWTEYPRPQMTRDQWSHLNGNWDYTVSKKTQTQAPDRWTGKILVPFSLESKLGGVQRLLAADEALWYHRTFEASPTQNSRTLLHFEAVDYQSQVFVNGKSVGTHTGGNTPFSFDVTDALKNGENTLVVRVEDETEEWQLNGKQRRNPQGIFYTQVSGIWQTVWMENVPTTHVTDLTIATDAASGEVRVQTKIINQDAVELIRVVVKDGDREVARQTVAMNANAEQSGTILMTIEDPKLWSPKSPHLYDLELTLLDKDKLTIDEIGSYFGIRTVGKAKDAEGHLRMTLNGEFIFHWGPLDQGWWPDGLLTPPSDEGMLFDIAWLKEAGFNMIRKHIKVEPRRYYYHCDRLGMMVWQDQVSGGLNPPWTRLRPDPKDAIWSDEDHTQFMLEFERMIDLLENHPSIVVWTPFNEAWGQHRTMEVGRWTMKRDPSRIVNIASGGNFWPVGDIADEHAYPNPNFPIDDARFNPFVKVVGEFGGHGYPVKGHLWDSERDNWGYGGLPKTLQEYKDRYRESLDLLDGLRQKGIAAGVYTQTTDVEGEINGLLTYDRKEAKISPEELNKMHQKLFAPIKKSEDH